MNIIEMKEVVKDYSLGKTIVKALKGIDLAIKKGDFISIVGPSGSGKTTLLNIIGCIDKASNGTVRLKDMEVTQLNDKKLTQLRLYTLGFIFQTFNLIPVLNVWENVEFPLLLMKRNNVSKKQIKKRVEQLVEEVGLKEHINHRPYELSGGQRQRVAIARALITQPEIILADEPTANLDSETGSKILGLMKDMNIKKKTTFIFSTHDPDILKYANVQIKLKDGCIVA